MFSKINFYLYKNYLIGLLIILLIFSILLLTGDLVENFRKSSAKEVPIKIIFQLSLYNFPSLIYEAVPIIIFFTYIFSTIRMVRSSEFTVLKSSGITNTSLLISPSILFFSFSVIFILTVNPLITVFHSKYEELNYKYIKQVSKFAAISKNGIWLKQVNNERNVSSILNSKNIEKEGEVLNNFMILEYNQKGSFTGRLNGEKAELKDGYWNLSNTTEYPRFAESKFYENLRYKTSIKYQDISNSLIDPASISIYELNEFINLIEKLGYSALDHKLEYYNLLILPFLIFSLTLLANSLTLSLNHNDKLFGLLTMSICTIFLYYFIFNLLNALALSSKISPIIAKILLPIILILISFLIKFFSKKLTK
tara:strand:- start:159 stop:1256 length:1098 start_codon:yes stop_codon:yes gene_type:complete